MFLNDGAAPGPKAPNAPPECHFSVMLNYVMLSYVMLCDVMLCYVNFLFF